MTWTSPATPVALTTITTDFWNVNARDNLNALRANTGGGDPLSAGQVVVATGAGLTAWGQLVNASYGDGTITAPKLVSGVAAANLAGSTVNGAVTVNGVVTVGGTGGLVNHGSAGLLNDGAAGTSLSGPGPHTFGGTGGVFVTNSAGMVVSGAAGLGVTSSGGVQVTNTLNAGTLQQGGVGVALAPHVTHAGNLVVGPGQVIDFDDALGAKLLLFATTFGIGINSGEVVLYAPPGNNVVVRDGAYNGTLRGQVALQNAAGKVPAAIAADTAGTASNASALGGVGPSGYATADRGVPSGAVVMFRRVGEIPSGWTREAAMDGRFAVGATQTGATSFGQTFFEFASDGVTPTNYGANWTPAAGVSANNGNLSASSSGIAASATPDFTLNPTGASFTDSNVHTHPAPTISLAGSVAIAGTATAWIPPSVGYAFARKT